MNIEEIKKEGIRKQLFESVGKALWMANCHTENARKTKGGKYKTLKTDITAARRYFEEAEKLHAELLKYSK